MLFRLMLKGVAKGRVRFLCAVAGVAIAIGTLTFMTSLVATNQAQAPELARRACAPWAAWKVDGIQVGRGRGMPPPAAEKDKAQGKPAGRPEGGRPEGRPEGMRGEGMRGGRGEGRRRGGPKPDLELKALVTTVDWRPDGHVTQGPPTTAFIAEAPAENPYATQKIAEGRWVDESSAEAEVVIAPQMVMRFSRKRPAIGDELKFVGRNGTMTARVVGYLTGGKLPAQFPYVFANQKAMAGFANEAKGTVSFFRELPKTPAPAADPEATARATPVAHGGGASAGAELLTCESESVINSFKGDEQRRMDYATPLLLIAAFLTALSLLVNTLLLSVEANRATLAKLRTVGMTRFGVVKFVAVEAAFITFVGWLAGGVFGCLALVGYVALDPAAFPVGAAFAWPRFALASAVLPLVTLLAILFALAPALRVRPMDAAAFRPRGRRRGMAITFALGYAAFVAVVVWGASLMRGFVPSPEWPDAIVSILPAGASSYDVEKLRTVDGVKQISELVPRQLYIKGGETPATDNPRTMRPNALFLAGEWLPKFNFIEGDWESANAAVMSSDAVVITRMMSGALNLHQGDNLVVLQPGRGKPGAAAPMNELTFPIVGVVDLNWHMVTSRGLVRGLNRMPGMTTGPVFCSLDTVGIVDPRTFMTEPAMSAPMTHLWVDYQPEFVAKLERELGDRNQAVFEAGRRIEAEITRRLGSPVESTVRLHARDEIADGTMAHGTDVIGQAAMVPFVFLAILAIGFVAMLVAEADARRREFRVLHAVGATKGQLAKMLVGSAVKVALLGIAIGLPLGAAAGWLTSTSTASMWPGMPHWFVIPWAVVIKGALGALAFALVFAVPTSLAIVKVKRRV